MLPRFHVGEHLVKWAGEVCDLPADAARHVQVRRMQPGEALHVFDGKGMEWRAAIVSMDRRGVRVRMEGPAAREAELPVRVTLAMGMPANDRMDALVEKATELGVWAVQPLVCERSVLRLDGERAAKKVAHWQAVAVAACEQSGRAVVPGVFPVCGLGTWLAEEAQRGADGRTRRAVLSVNETTPLLDWAASGGGVSPCGADSTSGAADMRAEGLDYVFLSGPEGGLAAAEEDAAVRHGWRPVSLGRRVLRADTAPLAALAIIAALHERR